MQGNPDLDSETIDTYEIALNYRTEVHTKLNIFYYRAKDLIYGFDSLVGARNLFDSDYIESSSIVVLNDYPMQGISIFAELRYKF